MQHAGEYDGYARRGNFGGLLVRNMVLLADRTARTMIGHWHDAIVCPSVRNGSFMASY